MIYNEDAYYTGYFRNVRELGAIPALVFDTICGLIREDGIGSIANSTMMEFLGIRSKNTLTDAIGKLVEAGYIEKTTGNGRSNKCTYYLTEKGSKNAPFMKKKGVKICTERGQNLNEKGSKNAPLNEELNKELKESGGDTRAAVSPQLSTTTENFETMEDFILFWNLYPEARDFEYEKEACELAWGALQQSWRNNLVQQLQQGKRWRPVDKEHPERNNPLWYIRNYRGELVNAELPFYRQQSAKFGKWYNENIEAGRKMALLRYEGTLAYCLEQDVQTMTDAGAAFLSWITARRDD